MITAIGRDENGAPLVYLGLTPENVRRMQAGDPVSVPAQRLRQMGIPNPVRIVVAAVESYEAGVAMIKESSPEVRSFTGDPVRPLEPLPPHPGTTRHPEQPCPACQHPLDSATDPRGKAGPTPGDSSVCINCGSFLVFGDGLVLRVMTIEEVAELDDNTRTELTRARGYVERMRGRRR